jgi:hypothetical protein
MVREALVDTPYALRFLNTEDRQDFPRGFSSDGIQSAVLERVLRYAKPNDVVMIAFHRGRLNADRDSHIPLGKAIEIDSRSLRLADSLGMYAEAFSNNDIHLLLVRDTPLMSMVATSESCHLQIKLFGSSACAVTREQDLHTRTRQDAVYDSVLAAHPATSDWDPGEILFGNGSRIDVVDAAGRYIMMDWHHLTREQSERLAPAFRDRLKGLGIHEKNIGR